jgi:hypothetical protein
VSLGDSRPKGDRAASRAAESVEQIAKTIALTEGGLSNQKAGQFLAGFFLNTNGRQRTLF